MPTQEPQEDKCGARVKNAVPDEWDEGYCANPEGFRTDHLGEGRCYLHGGASSTPNTGNTHNERHGLHTKRQRYYENRSPEEQQWIDAVVESLLDDAPFGVDSFAKMQMVRNIAIDMHKQQSANDYIDQEGIVQEDQVVGYSNDGKPIMEDQENTLNIAYDRLTRTITRQMKELNLLDSPDAKQAEANQNIANELSKIRQQSDN